MVQSLDGLVAAGLRAPTYSRSGLSWWHGWIPLAVLPAAVVALVPAAWPRWAFMWTLAFAIYCGCKWLTWKRTPTPGDHCGEELAIWRRGQAWMPRRS